MAAINSNNASKIKDCVKNVKNKFNLKWLEHIVNMDIGSTETTVRIGDEYSWTSFVSTMFKTN
jgi:hypothetical protein